MQGKGTRSKARQPALAAFLLVGAGVAVAQPVDKQRQPSPLMPTKLAAPVIRAATIRIVLPPPTAMAPASRPVSPGALHSPLEDLEATAPAEAGPAALALPAAKPPAPSPITRTAAIGQQDAQDLAAARGKAMATYSAARYEQADIRQPQSISMVGDDDWAAMTRASTAPETSPSATARVAALQPAKASPRAIAGAIPIALDPAPDSEAARMAAIDADAPKQRGIASVSLDVAAKVNGAAAGRVSLLIQDDENISVRLSDLLTVLQPRIEPDLYDRLSSAQAAQSYVTLNTLRAAGIAVRFDDRDRLLIGLK